MGWDGMGWDGMGWDGMGWDGMGWDGMGWEEARKEGSVLRQLHSLNHSAALPMSSSRENGHFHPSLFYPIPRFTIFPQVVEHVTLKRKVAGLSPGLVTY
jgi:hypothetical protein